MSTQVLERTQRKQKHYYQARPVNEKKQDSGRSGKSLARLLTAGFVILLVLAVIVAGMSAYTTHLDVVSSQTKNEIANTEERIEELKHELDVYYTDVLVQTVTPEEDVEVADNSYFVRDTWDVGG